MDHGLVHRDWRNLVEEYEVEEIERNRMMMVEEREGIEGGIC